MEFTDNPLEPTITDRGLAYMQPITTREGATVEVHDSSNAEHDEVWFEFGPVLEQSTLDGKHSLAVGIGDALMFAQQIIAVAERRGFRLVDLAGDPAPEVIDGLVAELDTATAKLNAVLPEPEGETRSDSGDILELGAYLATVYTAAALAGAIPRLIGDLDITAYTADINAHLESAAEAARHEIHALALDTHITADRRVFPPRPHHLNTVGDYLSNLRTGALALAGRAEVVRAEIECYLAEDPEPEPIPEYARGLLNTTPNPECSCDDGNCDDCKRDRANTESEER